MPEVTLQVPEIHCAGCCESIRKALSGRPGVEKVEVDLDQKAVRVRYNEEETGVRDLRAWIERAGFDVA